LFEIHQHKSKKVTLFYIDTFLNVCKTSPTFLTFKKVFFFDVFFTFGEYLCAQGHGYDKKALSEQVFGNTSCEGGQFGKLACEVDSEEALGVDSRQR